MNETEPNYITQLKDSIINLDRKLDSGFKLIKDDIGEIKNDIEILAISTAKNTKDIDWIKDNIVVKSDMDNIVTKDYISDMVTVHDISDMTTKSDIKPILNLIGSYEVRAKNTEDIVLHDHRPRIIDLEKEVFA